MTDSEKISILPYLLEGYGICFFFCVLLLCIERVYVDHMSLNKKFFLDVLLVSSYGCFILIPWTIKDLVLVRMVNYFKGNNK